MPALVRSKTFQIPLSREPKKNDVIILAATIAGADEDEVTVVTSIYDGSSWTALSTDTPYKNEPSYANGFINFSVDYFRAVIPFKATYVTGWEDS